jgi:glucose-6-phosphate 1-dehydrogenase
VEAKVEIGLFQRGFRAKGACSLGGKRDAIVKKIAPGVGLKSPQVVVLVGATGDLATGLIRDVLEAYERLILDAMRGDHTLFTTAEGIERLWEVSKPLLEAPPPVRLYPPGSWGPKSIHQLVAPHAWRLPFERGWRDPNPVGS